MSRASSEQRKAITRATSSGSTMWISSGVDRTELRLRGVEEPHGRGRVGEIRLHCRRGAARLADRRQHLVGVLGAPAAVGLGRAGVVRIREAQVGDQDAGTAGGAPIPWLPPVTSAT
jgi:hypothetical protein